MKETSIYFLRHGVTDWNLEGRWQGQTDVPLNGDGIAQAEAVAERLAAIGFDRIYSSDLDRALTTARSVESRQVGAELVVTESWRERFAGVFEGLTSAEISVKYPDAYAEMMAGRMEPPEGESFAEFSRRIDRELGRITREHEGETILVVSHGGAIRGMGHVTLGVPQEKVWSLQVGNTALSHMVSTRRGWRMEFWNDFTHLDSPGLSSNQNCLTL